MALQLVTPPFEEPYTVAQAKLSWRVTIDEDDLLIASLITASREHAEVYCRRQVLTATFALYLDHFPCAGLFGSFRPRGLSSTMIELPRPPLQSVTAITYLDCDGVSQTLSAAAYGVDTASEPGRVYLNSGYYWPGTIEQPNAVRIEYTAGWLSVEEIPQALVVGMKLLGAYWYEQREAGSERPISIAPLGVQLLFNQQRIVEAY